MEELKWDEWYAKHLPEISAIQTELEKPLPDDLHQTRQRLIYIEGQYSRVGKLLADANSILVVMSDEINDIPVLAKVKRIRDILAVQQKGISKRITVGQSMIKSFREEEILNRTMENR